MEAWTLPSIALALLAFAAVSGRLRRSVVTAPMFFLTAGLVAGPLLGVIDLKATSAPVKLLAEATLTLVLFADASRVSVRVLRRDHALPVRLLGIGLPLTILLGAIVGAVVLPGVSLVEALVIAIMVACTDAALGQTVVSDERVPARVRQALNIESGLNDGLCVPLFYLAIAIATADSDVASWSGAFHLVYEEVGFGLVAGIGAGVVGGIALRECSRRNLIAPNWLQILPVATAVLAAGIADALHGSIFIAAFAAGTAFGRIRRTAGGEVTFLLEQGGELLNGVTFVIFGAVILGPVLGDVTFAAVLYAILSLTVVRMLPVAAALLGSGAKRPTQAFIGWFGPRGLASIVFAVLLVDGTQLPHEATMVQAVVVTVGLSVYAHGLTAVPLTDRYVSWYGRHPSDTLPELESRPVIEHVPVRR